MNKNLINIFMPLVFLKFLTLMTQTFASYDYCRARIDARQYQEAVNREFYNAAENGSLELMSQLLRKGADVNAKIHPGHTALYIAAKNNHLDCVTFLLERNVDVNENSLFGTALHDAGACQIVKALIAAKANVNSTYLPRRPLACAAKRGHNDSVKALLEAGADVYAQDREGVTALHEAVQAGHGDCVRTLIEAKADINAQQRNGWTPLHVAANYGKVDCLKILLDSKVDLYILDQGHDTALEWTAHRGHIDCFMMLIKYSYCLLPSAGIVSQSRKKVFTILLLVNRLRHEDPELDNLKSESLVHEILSWDKDLEKDLAIILLDEIRQGREIKAVALIRAKEAAVRYLLTKLKNLSYRVSRRNSTAAVKAPDTTEENLGALVREGLNERIEELKSRV